MDSMTNDTMNENERALLEQKANHFYQEGQMVHIEAGKQFFNGYIFDINSDFLIINDRMLGEYPVWFVEITKFEKFISEDDND